MHSTIMALQEHFGNTGSHSEITVDLEWRMGIEEVGISPSILILWIPLVFFSRQQGQHIADNLEGMVAIQHTGPEVCLPSQAPSCGLVSTLPQRIGCRMEKLRMRIWGDLIGWIQTIKMRDVAMLIMRVIGIHQPFLQLSVLSHLHRWQTIDGSLIISSILSILAQHFSCMERIVQCVKRNLIVHRTTSRHRCFLARRTLLRTDGWNSYLPWCFRQWLHIVEIEISSTLQHGIPLS